MDCFVSFCSSAQREQRDRMKGRGGGRGGGGEGGVADRESERSRKCARARVHDQVGCCYKICKQGRSLLSLEIRVFFICNQGMLAHSTHFSAPPRLPCVWKQSSFRR